MKPLLLIAIGVALLATGLYKLTLIGIERQIAHECAVWNDQAQQYPGVFYWTDWQIDQCHPEFLPETNIPYRNDEQKYR